MAASPVSLIVRGVNASDATAVLDRCQSFLTGRRQPDEIILGFAEAPPHRPPSTFGRLHVRTVVHPNIAERQGLEWLIANAKWPVAVFVGCSAELPATDFRKMLESLEHADVVIGRRRSVRGSRRPTAVLLRKIFGVATSDPLSPYLALRRQSVAGIPLELDEPLARFELLAKLTFAFAMYDEVQVELSASPEEPLHRVFRSRWHDLSRFYREPAFWEFSESGGLRLAPQDSRPPAPGATAVDLSHSAAAKHPLRPSWLLNAHRDLELSQRILRR